MQMSNDFINFIEGIIFIMIVLPPTTKNVIKLVYCYSNKKTTCVHSLILFPVS